MPNGAHTDFPDEDLKIVGDKKQEMKDGARSTGVVNYQKLHLDLTLELDTRVLAKLPDKENMKNIGRRAHHAKFKLPDVSRVIMMT